MYQLRWWLLFCTAACTCRKSGGQEDIRNRIALMIYVCKVYNKTYVTGLPLWYKHIRSKQDLCNWITLMIYACKVQNSICELFL
jgi:hypothetical protein